MSRLQPVNPADEGHLEDMRRAAWLKQGIVTIRPNEVNETWFRAKQESWAMERWGKRSDERIEG